MPKAFQNSYSKRVIPRQLFSRMTMNVSEQIEKSEPYLVGMDDVNMDNMDKRGVFTDPYGMIWTICWDTKEEIPVVLSEFRGPINAARVNCNGTNKTGEQFTVKDIVKMIGFEVDYESSDGTRLANVMVSDDMYMEPRNLVEMTVKTMPISMFELDYDYDHIYNNEYDHNYEF